MKIILSIVVVFLLSDCCAELVVTSESSVTPRRSHENSRLLNPNTCGIGLWNDRIIGGGNTRLGEHPWMARIGVNELTTLYLFTLYICGGALINNRYVLTAAHCVTDIPVRGLVSTIQLGEYNVETDVDCDGERCSPSPLHIKPDAIIPHEEYLPKIFKNDIALVRLSKKVPFSEWIRPVCLPMGSLLTKDFTGSQGTILGFGVVNLESQEIAKVLQSVEVPIVSIRRCIKTYPDFKVSTEAQLCAGGVIGKDSCLGDSGGPMVKVEDADGTPRYYLVGIVSFGPKKCAIEAPAVYDNVQFYVPWILDNIEA